MKWEGSFTEILNWKIQLQFIGGGGRLLNVHSIETWRILRWRTDVSATTLACKMHNLYCQPNYILRLVRHYHVGIHMHMDKAYRVKYMLMPAQFGSAPFHPSKALARVEQYNH
jgi:hypothetical protein